jgi:hypothetical protein
MIELKYSHCYRSGGLDIPDTSNSQICRLIQYVVLCYQHGCCEFVYRFILFVFSNFEFVLHQCTRNQEVFNLKNVDNKTVIEQALRNIQEFQKSISNDIINGTSQHSQSHMSNNQRHGRRPSSNKRWTRLDNNKIKINCDANLAVEGRWGLGVSFRNADGALLLAATWVMPGSSDPKLAEAYAVCIKRCF